MLNNFKSRYWVIIFIIVIVTAVGFGLIANPKVKEAELPSDNTNIQQKQSFMIAVFQADLTVY